MIRVFLSYGGRMPRKPKHPCSYPGCPNLTYSRYCEEHERFMMRRYNSVERNPRAKKLLGYILFRYDEDETILLDVLTIPATIIIRLLFPSYKSLSNADAEMVSEYRKTHESAGAILLIAASSDAEGMEIRKAMLEELEKAEKDREICILTNGENSRFLEENGFRKVAERNIKARKRSFIRMLYSRGIEPLESAPTLQGPQHYQWV